MTKIGKFYFWGNISIDNQIAPTIVAASFFVSQGNKCWNKKDIAESVNLAPKKL